MRYNRAEIQRDYFKGGIRGLRASIEESEGTDDEEEAEREGKEAPGGGSVRSNLSSFCIRRLSLACAIFLQFWETKLDFAVSISDGNG